MASEITTYEKLLHITEIKRAQLEPKLAVLLGQQAVFEQEIRRIRDRIGQMHRQTFSTSSLDTAMVSDVLALERWAANEARRQDNITEKCRALDEEVTLIRAALTHNLQQRTQLQNFLNLALQHEKDMRDDREQDTLQSLCRLF